MHFRHLCTIYILCTVITLMSCQQRIVWAYGVEKLSKAQVRATANEIEKTPCKTPDDIARVLHAQPSYSTSARGRHYDVWHYSEMYTNISKGFNTTLVAESSKGKLISMGLACPILQKWDTALVDAVSATPKDSLIPALSKAWRNYMPIREADRSQYLKMRVAFSPGNEYYVYLRDDQEISKWNHDGTYELVSIKKPHQQANSHTEAAPTATHHEAYASHANSQGDLEAGCAFLSWNNSATINRMLKNKQFSTIQSIEKTLGSKAHATGSSTDGSYHIWQYNWSSANLKHHHTCMLIAQCQGNKASSVAYLAILEDGKNRFSGDQSLISKIEYLQTHWNTSVANQTNPGLYQALQTAVNQSTNATIPYIQQRGAAIKNDQMAGIPSLGEVMATSLVNGLVEGAADTYLEPAVPPSNVSTGSGAGRSKRSTLPREMTCPMCHGTGYSHSMRNMPNYGTGYREKYRPYCKKCGGKGKVKY